jgi:DNA polymerase-3 subunit delta
MSKPVYALIGDDSYLQLQQLASLTSEFPADAQRIDVDGERAELSDVFDELRSFAMFGGSKIVVMRNADAFITRYREQLEDYLAAPSNSATLVMRVASLPSNQRIYKAIAKAGQIVQCVPPKDRELPKWIIDHAKRVHQVNVAQDAALQLADLIGCDLGRLDSELAKLALMKDDGKIDVKDVAGSVSFQREQEMWDMTNALAAGDAAEALRRWRHLVQLDPSTEFRAVTWLSMWLEDVRAVVTKKDSGKLTWKYKDKFNQFLQNANALGRPGLGKAVDLLAEIDKQSKSGVGDAAENVERFIISIAKTNQ